MLHNFLTTESNVMKELTALEEIGRKIVSENRPNFGSHPFLSKLTKTLKVV